MKIRKFNNLGFIISFFLTGLLTIMLVLSMLTISAIISYQSKVFDRKNKEVIVNLIRKDLEKKVPDLIDDFKVKKFLDFVKQISEKYGVIINVQKKNNNKNLKYNNSSNICETEIFVNPDKNKFNNFEPMMRMREMMPSPARLNRRKIPDAVIVLSYKNFNYYFLIWFLKISRGYYITKVKNGIIFVFIIVLIFSIIISIVFSRKVSFFIKKLRVKMEEVANGNFGQIIEENPIKEINDLNLAFNKMSLKLKEFKEERKRITSNISHEIRTPLTILKSYMEGFKDKILFPDNETINEMMEEIKRLEQMVENLKILTEIEENKNFEKVKILNVNNIIESLIKKNRFLFKKENVKIIKDIENINIKFSESDFISLIMNLIKNGIKYNNKKQKIIKIRAFKTKNNEFILSVRDNGNGIEDKYKDLVFERFFRIDSSRNAKTGGRGLGLAIVKEIVTKYNGRITINSEKNKFTEFRIKFKLA